MWAGYTRPSELDASLAAALYEGGGYAVKNAVRILNTQEPTPQGA